MNETTNSLSDDSRIAHYRIVRKIGAGGMGEVYLAEDTKLDRKVALKILPPEFAEDADRMSRFVREAKAASALNHPNIITIHEIGEAGGTHFIATEFIDGKTLSDYAKSNSLNYKSTLEIAIQVASALDEAHQAGIVHRDIKPDNVMVRKNSLVKILDFGIAKLSAPTSTDEEAATAIKGGTSPGMIIGTANYMSPEQAKGREVDARTDIFSFGAVLYEMLTEQQPFTGETINHTIVAILEKEPPPVSQFVKDCPAELEMIIQKTLAKNADNRYQSAKELFNDLKSLHKRLEFEDELERNQSPNKNSDAETQIFKAESSEETPSFPPSNLAQNLSPIIGRKKELAEVKKLLKRENVRLVTMTGIGGAGKTRLAQAVAQSLLNDFKDGVFFVELDAITNAELVASTVAQRLGLKEAGEKPILEILKDYLRDKQILLVIDNFEQVIAAAPNIAELLSVAAKLKILITSRTVLHLSSEREFVVPPLSFPADVSQVSLDELSNYEAIKLFVERARNAKSNFVLQEENARSVTEICVRLDGLPLAIELAAARVKILSPQMILTKLENSLKLLTGGARDLPARQQTMRGAVEWSYELLSEDEKKLFRRLAVFAGGFTIESAEAVCADYELQMTNDEPSEDRIEVLDLVASLVDKSLLAAKEQTGGETRFRLLEVVREYALESLETSGEAEAMRRRHADYFLALGEASEPHLQGAESAEWLNRLEEEHDNLRAALAYLLERDAIMAARLAAAIRSYWTLHNHLVEGRKSLKAALERGAAAPAAVRFKMLNGLALAARLQGDYAAAREAYEEGLAEGKAANDLQQITMSSLGLGVVAKRQGDYSAARQIFEEGLAISRKLNDKSGIAITLNMLGDLARTEGNNAAARPLLEEALALHKQNGNKEGICISLGNLGAVAYDENDLLTAHSHYTDALAAARELGNKIDISLSLDGFAALAAKHGDAERATRLAAVAEHLRELIGYEMETADLSFRDAYLAELRAVLDEADFSIAYEQGRNLKLEEAVALCLEETDGENKTTIIKTA
ncbi:MAG: protein kinase [Acidobacteria bacterium]|nr:protein kinase [Acidobacteriota bacterium]